MSRLASPKATEKFFGTYLTKLIYAAIAQLKSAHEGDTIEEKYSSAEYMSYATLAGVDAGVKLKPAFAIGGDVRQMLAAIFNKVEEELEELEPALTEDMEFGEFYENTVDESYLRFIYLFGRERADFALDFGPALRDAIDPTQWIPAQLIAAVPNFVKKPMIAAKSYVIITNFLKTLAFKCALWLWHVKRYISRRVFAYILLNEGLPPAFARELLEVIRESTKRAGKKPAEPAGDEVPTAVEPADA